VPWPGGRAARPLLRAAPENSARARFTGYHPTAATRSSPSPTCVPLPPPGVRPVAALCAGPIIARPRDRRRPERSASTGFGAAEGRRSRAIGTPHLAFTRGGDTDGLTRGGSAPSGPAAPTTPRPSRSTPRSSSRRWGRTSRPRSAPSSAAAPSSAQGST
jgi:hypothetical protein